MPEFKANLTSRYGFTLAGMDAYVQGSYVHTGASWNTLFDGSNNIRNRRKQHAYDILNLAVGVEQGGWAAEFFIRNLTTNVAKCSRTAPLGTPASPPTDPAPSGCVGGRSFSRDCSEAVLTLKNTSIFNVLGIEFG